MSVSILRCISSSLSACNRSLIVVKRAETLFKSAPLCSSFYSSKSLLEDHEQSIKSEQDPGKPKSSVPAKTRKRGIKTVIKPEVSHKSTQDSLPVQQVFPFEGNLSLKEHKADQTVQQVNSNGCRHYKINCSEMTYVFPSVTSVLESTMPREMFFRLHNWRKNMIKEHGQSKSNDIAREILRSGKNFHKDIEQVLREGASQDIISIKPYITSASRRGQQGSVGGPREPTGYMQSVQHVLKDISDVCAIESVVSHLELGYTGMFDCLARYRGDLCVIDWKTSSKPKPTLADCYTHPLQAAAYAGALNQDQHYPYKVENALIVIVYPNGDPAHGHFLSHNQLLSYWDEWLQRLEQYQTQFASDLSEI